MFTECNYCKFVCLCCKSNSHERCSGCEGPHDEFILNKDFIKFCPRTGKKRVFDFEDDGD